ncbi:MAG: asparagine synthase (glutamine-hydrolyzing) [Verrucomicrobiae bacterium]|nr:asparagine synthase (glutamine-hydrolyzing) [Verrucomicrobiae bacterium]MCP5541757.1 asparagine synthase (glutamine-hydrolyzing) [Akkermansiaceae bacterium]
MCAIFGFAGFRDTALLHRMAETLHHRGPDGRGFFEGERFSMGNCRLSIIDLAGGDQPIYNEDGSLAVVQNGEIYNYVELREQLEARGHVFKTHSDTEVLVHGYEEWGRDLPKRLNGMYAFAVHDRRSGDTFIARDRCGQKPFYYWHGNGRFVFASEAKAILECPFVERAPNLAAIDSYLCLRNVPEPETMFAGIYLLPVAHSMLLKSTGEFAIERYWSVPLRTNRNYLSDGEYLEMLEAKFRDAVRLTMRSDVPVSSYLSAGVDSSLITAAAREFNDNLHTFSIGFNSPIDETRDAAETARLLGTTHHEIQVTPEDFELLPRVVWQMDRPVGDALILAFDRLAANCGKDFKVVLGGEGADEMFAGYQFHKVMPMVEKYHRLVPGFIHHGLMLPGFRATPMGILNRFFEFPADLGKAGKKRLADFLAMYGKRDLRRNYYSLRTLWSLDERHSIYADDFKHRATRDWIPPERPEDRDSGAQFLDRLLKLQYDEWLQDWALIRQDKNTMAHSLEIRLPFLDHELIEMAFQMPPHLKARGGRDKIVERQLAGKMLPPAVSNRPKNPFFLPMAYFYQNPTIREMIDETLSPDRIKKRGYFDPAKVKALVDGMAAGEFVGLKQVMSLVILELWHMIFVDRELRFP